MPRRSLPLLCSRRRPNSCYTFGTTALPFFGLPKYDFQNGLLVFESDSNLFEWYHVFFRTVCCYKGCGKDINWRLR
jgi:hypothetical protein